MSFINVLMVVFISFIVSLTVNFYVGRIIIFEIKRRIETGEWARKVNDE